LLPEWRRRLPELAKRLEEVLYRKFPNKNDYYNMMKGPIEPHLQFAIRTLSAQNQQIQQNLQNSRETTSSSGTMIPVVSHDALCEQSASLLADTQNNNADERDRTGEFFALIRHYACSILACIQDVQNDTF